MHFGLRILSLTVVFSVVVRDWGITVIHKQRKAEIRRISIYFSVLMLLL